jgi:hypothetical protein
VETREDYQAKADEVIAELLVVLQDINDGRPLPIHCAPGVIRADGTVSCMAYRQALVCALAEGMCPWDGSTLTGDLVCRHPVHGKAVQWSRDGVLREW